MHTLLVVGLLVVSATTAAANPDIRLTGASARVIGCTRVTITCDGATSIRMGLSVVDVGWLADGSGPLVTFHQASRPEGGLIASHTLAMVAYRHRIGAGWLQAGHGLAIAGVGVRTVKSSRLLDPDVRSAFAVGGGMVLQLWEGRPITVALDVSSSHDADIHQVTASLSSYTF